jgi:hypothetical protein
MLESIKLDLYYFNYEITLPIVFFIIKIQNDKEEKFIEKNTNFLFKTLIEQNYAPSNSIVIFNILKQHSNKIINWILPSMTTNLKFLKQIENDNHLINSIIVEIIKNYNCKNLFVFSSDELTIKSIDINLNYLINYFI